MFNDEIGHHPRHPSSQVIIRNQQVEITNRLQSTLTALQRKKSQGIFSKVLESRVIHPR